MRSQRWRLYGLQCCRDVWTYQQLEAKEDRMAKLLFIPQDTPDGSTGPKNRPLISAHTLKHNRKLTCQARHRNNGTARPRSLMPRGKPPLPDTRNPKPFSRRIEAEIVSVAARTSESANDSTSLRSDSTQTRGVALLLVKAPRGPIICGQDREDVQSIGQWYFLNQLHETQVSYFRHAQDHWTTGLWEMALANQAMLASLVALASYREVALARGRFESSYIELKGRAISQIGKTLNRRHDRTDPLTLVAIALLAYLDVRDSHLDAARLHLLAVCNLVDITEMPAYAWLYCVWVDLRFALLIKQPPILPYHIPSSFQQSRSCRPSDELRATQRASLNVANCPQTISFDHHTAFDIFNKLHHLCMCSDQLGKSKVPPFGQIYDLEYALRVIQSQVSKEESQCHTFAAVELTILAAQLHVWMACRFWTPQRRESHLAFLSRASSIFDSFSDISLRWTDFATLESLLWILFTTVAMMRIYGEANLTPMLDLLYSTLRTLGIHHHQELAAELHEWPWISDWHPSQIVHVWTLLTERFDDLVVAMPDALNTANPTLPDEPPQRLFLGGLEYFHSP